MKAKNPNGDGFVEVGLPQGPDVVLWSKVCGDCDAVAGGCFSGHGLPEPQISKYAICPGCGGQNLKLVKESDQTKEEFMNATATPICTKRDTGLWMNDPLIPGGKYLIMRRDGTVFPEPNFVLGARDPAAPIALRAYADACEKLGVGNPQYVKEVRELADRMEEIRSVRGNGDPGKGPHRIDHPLVIEQMLRPDRRILAPEPFSPLQPAERDIVADEAIAEAYRRTFRNGNPDHSDE